MFRGFGSSLGFYAGINITLGKWSNLAIAKQVPYKHIPQKTDLLIHPIGVWPCKELLIHSISVFNQKTSYIHELVHRIHESFLFFIGTQLHGA